jgi:hypothetical protein
LARQTCAHWSEEEEWTITKKFISLLLLENTQVVTIRTKKESFGENAKRTFVSRVVFSTMPRKLHRAKRANGGKFLVVERIFGESLILAIHL